jgi:hypothetical protein
MITPPSRSRKFRTHPMRSGGWPSSMRDSATNGVHCGRPLKSRTRAQTASAGASMTLDV